jgi:hypothetical protein
MCPVVTYGTGNIQRDYYHGTAHFVHETPPALNNKTGVFIYENLFQFLWKKATPFR